MFVPFFVLLFGVNVVMDNFNKQISAYKAGSADVKPSVNNAGNIKLSKKVNLYTNCKLPNCKGSLKEASHKKNDKGRNGIEGRISGKSKTNSRGIKEKESVTHILSKSGESPGIDSKKKVVGDVGKNKSGSYCGGSYFFVAEVASGTADALVRKTVPFVGANILAKKVAKNAVSLACGEPVDLNFTIADVFSAVAPRSMRMMDYVMAIAILAL